ncbi:MAG: trypsin-like peptidase domain-containing protein [Acidobacteria bacterium]|nr:trypsin-like peptidase domain-containing protein [Acidobacteriota bacterium]
MSLFFRLLVILIVSVFLFDTGFAQRKPRVTQSKAKPVLSAQKIAERFLPSVVLIVCDDGKGKVSLGSGFFIEFSGELIRSKDDRPLSEEDLAFLRSPRSNDKSVPAGENVLLSYQESSYRYVLTNYHVVEGMVRGKVKVAVGGKNSAEWWIGGIVFVDKQNDLALLSIQIRDDRVDLTTTPPTTIKGSGTPNPPPNLVLSESDQVKIGEEVYVLSNPEGLAGTLSRGIVSSNIRQIRNVSLMQFDAPISSGSSGGAVLNSKGEVIGVATGTFSSGQNLNFAVPASSVRRFLREYEESVKNLNVVKSAVPNGWGILVPRAPESKLPLIVSDSGNTEKSRAPNDDKRRVPDNVIDSEKGQKEKLTSPFPDASKTKNIGEMTYDEIASDLSSFVANSSILRTHDNTYSSKVSISFFGCSMAVTKTSHSAKGDFDKESYSVDLRHVKNFARLGNRVPHSIRFELAKNIVSRSEDSSGNFEAVLLNKFGILFLDTDTEDITRAISKFRRIQELCSGSSPIQQPSYVDTVTWLIGRLEGSVFRTIDMSYKYERLKISGCSMEFTVHTQGKIGWRETHRPDLRFSKKVEVSRNTHGDWGVWLDFGRNFDVSREWVGSNSNRENEKKDTLTIFFDSNENAKRVASAFSRLLEICGEEIRMEPF